MSKNTTTIIIGMVLIIAAFFGGMFYGQSKTPTVNQGARNGNFLANGGGMRNGRTGGGFSGGQIISKDTTGVTIKAQNGNSEIVLISNSTPVLKFVAGSLNDLSVGQDITVTGTPNSDGSITAQSIQIRPATTTRPINQ